MCIRDSISFIGIEVVVGLFAHGEWQYHDEGADVGDEEAHTKYLDELRECIDQKKHIKEEFELIVEHQRDEGKHIVLGIFDDVILVIGGVDFSW